MAKKNKICTNFDLFVNVLKLEKNQCAFELYDANEKLEKVNQKVKNLKIKIVDCEQKIREGVGSQGVVLSVDNYEMIRNNLTGLNEELKVVQKEELHAKQIYQSALDELQKKTRCHEKITDKQLIRRDEIIQERVKKIDLELDDLCAQRRWISEHG